MTFSIESAERLPADFYCRKTADVARALIGKTIVHRTAGTITGGIVVETEAYLHRNDPASHSARGRTASNESMFLRPGTLYVYPIHAKYCLNAVTEEAGTGAAVLIRAIEPTIGIETMCGRRGQSDLRRLTTGPAMLCQALSIDRSDDGRCLVGDSDLGIFLNTADDHRRRIVATKRIGISKAQHRNLRFVDMNSRFLSRPVPKR
ncbi:DNA-3-methyladenine glycosylase [Stieleria sp. JC731]|uniref:DNA-3-methyladenine glycosylase n=1 Tax=Pirellulaceae TaxID=2691357 RepID=UPI001E4D8FD7|nr:DNA-3-methyladenine glycosylase [Stieleria sp. JC731]MCC9604190.1 DNA-3-methyladenine glycosylase [Stieleria sp. JC731]